MRTLPSIQPSVVCRIILPILCQNTQILGNCNKTTDASHAHFLCLCALLEGKRKEERCPGSHESICRSGGTGPLIPNIGTTTRWVISFTGRPLYPAYHCNKLGVPSLTCPIRQRPAPVAFFSVQTSRCPSPSFRNFHRCNAAVGTAFVYTNTRSRSPAAVISGPSKFVVAN